MLREGEEVRGETQIVSVRTCPVLSSDGGGMQALRFFEAWRM